MSEVQKEVHPQGAAAETTSNPMLGQAGSLQQESATGGGTHSPGGTILRPASGDHLSAMAGNAPPTDLPPIDIHGHAHTRSKNNSMHKWSLAGLFGMRTRTPMVALTLRITQPPAYPPTSPHLPAHLPTHQSSRRPSGVWVRPRRSTFRPSARPSTTLFGRSTGR